MVAVTIPVVSSRSLVEISDFVERSIGLKSLKSVYATQGLSWALRLDPNRFIPNMELVAFLEAMARKTGSDCFGLLAGQNLPFANLASFGTYVTTAPDLKSALLRAATTISHYETGSQIGVEDLGEELKLTYRGSCKEVLGSSHHSDGVAIILVNLIRQFAGPGWAPRQLQIDHSKRERLTKLEDAFKFPVHLNGSAIGIPVHKSLVGLPPRLPIGQEKMRAYSDLRDLVIPQPPRLLSEVVKEVISEQLCDGPSDLERTARRLNLHPRTLQRRLKAEGAKFRIIMNQTLVERGNEYLAHSNLAVANIAARLGYSSKQHFIRAYKRAARETPGQARKRLLG